ncbi:MAG: tetratricopeptide repeat protein [Alphaproteobacteria bacterium]
MSHQKINDLLIKAKQYHNENALEKAKPLYEETLGLDPNHFDGLRLYALLLAQMGFYTQSEPFFERALAIDPNHTALLANYSLMLNRIGKYDKGIILSDRLISLSPDLDQSQSFNRVLLLRNAGQYKRADSVIQQNMKRFPQYIDLKREYAFNLCDLGQHKQALELYADLMKDNPDHTGLLSAYGVLLERYGFYKRAAKAYEKSLALDPNQPQTRFNYSLLLMLIDDYDQGLIAYEARWQSVAFNQDPAIIEIRRQLPFPQWDGKQSLDGKSILIYTEQGLGDVLHFLRYLPLLKQLGASIFMMVRKSHKPILPLLKNDPAISGFVDVNESFQACDYHCGLLSLALYLRPKFDLFTPPAPGLISPNIERKWQKTLGKKHESKRASKRIGFVLSGSGNIIARDMGIKDWQFLQHSLSAPLDRVEWVCLQKELSAAQSSFLAKNPNSFRFFGSQIHNFEDTAAIINECDMVITIDTSVAHLAGIMAQAKDKAKNNAAPFVHLLMPHLPSFRWGLKASTTAWYPNMMIWRQLKQGDWQHPILKLKDYVSTHYQDWH